MLRRARSSLGFGGGGGGGGRRKICIIITTGITLRVLLLEHVTCRPRRTFFKVEY